MNDASSPDHDQLIRQITRDLADSYDEELEMKSRIGCPANRTQRIRKLKGRIACATSTICSGCRPQDMVVPEVY